MLRLGKFYSHKCENALCQLQHRPNLRIVCIETIRIPRKSSNKTPYNTYLSKRRSRLASSAENCRKIVLPHSTSHRRICSYAGVLKAQHRLLLGITNKMLEIYHVLHQYQSGKQTEIPFARHNYQEKYEEFYALINEWILRRPERWEALSKELGQAAL